MNWILVIGIVVGFATVSLIVATVIRNKRDIEALYVIIDEMLKTRKS